MKRLRNLPVAEIVIVALAFGALVVAAYLSATREQRQTKVDTLSTYDAASGGYRAWYEMLQREGIDVQRFERRPAFLDASVDVYVSASAQLSAIEQAQYGAPLDIMNDGDWSALATWVKAGGHFVWIADGEMTPSYLNAPRTANEGPASDAALTVAPSALTDGVRAVSGTAKLRVPFDATNQPAPVIADDTGAVVASYPLGKGTVTVVTDDSLFRNDRLARADNARLAYNLAAAGLGPNGTVAFDEWSHGFAAGDNWWTVLPRQAQIALAIIALGLFALAAGTAFRFGPVVPAPDPDERTSAEYVTSMALLLERGNAVRATLNDMADACLREVAAALGLPETAPARTVAARAGIAGEAAERVMELDRLRSYEYPHVADLLRAAQLCTQLRKEYAAHARIGFGRRTPAARRTA